MLHISRNAFAYLFLLTFPIHTLAAPPPCTLAPLTQPGSPNLLPPNFNSWNLHGDAHPATADNQPALDLGPKRNNQPAGFHLSLPAKPNTLYQLTFRYRASPDLQWDYAHDNEGLDGWLVASAKSKDLRDTRLYTMQKPPDWQSFQTFLFTPAGTDTLSWQLSLNASAGRLLLADPILREAPIPQSENRQLLTFNNTAFAELPRHPEPPAPNSLTLFHRTDPDQLFFYSHPLPEETTRPIQLTATPGELALAAIAVYSPAAATLHFQITPLLTANSTPLLARPLLCPIQFTPRRNDYYGRGATWHFVADSLQPPTETIAVPADQTQVLWLKLPIPADAPPGDYCAQFLLKSDHNPDASLPIHLRILPIQLLQPLNKTFGLYADADRWKNMSDPQIAAELADIKAHGIDSLLLPDDLGQPLLQNQSVTAWQWSPLMLRAMPLVQSAGLRGPFRHWLEHLPETLAKKLNLKIDESSPESWPPALAAAFQQTLRLINADVAARRWGPCAFEGIDEPGYWKKGSPPIFAWQYQNARDAAIPTYCTSSYLPSDPLGKFLDFHAYTGRCYDGPERSALICQATRDAHQKPWLYATGSYSNQIGNLIHNRYASGFIFYRTGADGLVSWTFQRPKGDPLNDFANKTYQSFITLPDPHTPGNNLDTPQWEGLRQGWLDYRYAITAAAALAAAQRTHNPAAPAAQKDFDTLFQQMPWYGTVFENCPITTDTCNQYRARLANLILTLQK